MPGTDEIYHVSYSFDSHGRIATQQAIFGTETNTFHFNYLQGSSLISSITNNLGFGISKYYEDNRNLIVGVSNYFGANSISSFIYENDSLGRRTERLDFDDNLFAITNSFAYNHYSEVTNAVMNENNYNFVFDDLGNRTDHLINDIPAEYYGDWPDERSGRMNRYGDILSTNLVYNKEYNFDEDGNMTSVIQWAMNDASNWPTWTYIWNGENRMVSATNAVDNTYITYSYDYQGRMISKNTSHGGTETRRDFIWNGNYIVAEMTASTTNLYTWLNGETLTASIDGETIFYCHDANKNVTDLVDDTGNLVAHYEYSPFGVITEQTGTLASENLFRFSNEVFDETTGFVEFVFRPYFPPLGKFLSRDPIEENGDLNLYGIGGNDLVNYWDEWGLYSPKFGWSWPLDKRAYVINIFTVVEVRLYHVVKEMDVLIKEAKGLPTKCKYKEDWLDALAETLSVFESTLDNMKSDKPIKVYRNRTWATYYSIDKDEDYAFVVKGMYKLVVNDSSGSDTYFFGDTSKASQTVLHEMTHLGSPASDDGESGKGWMNAHVLEEAMNHSMRYTLSSEWRKMSLPEIIDITREYDDCCDGYDINESNN